MFTEKNGKSSFGRIAPAVSLGAVVFTGVWSVVQEIVVHPSTLDLLTTSLYVTFGAGYGLNKVSTAWKEKK